MDLQGRRVDVETFESGKKKLRIQKLFSSFICTCTTSKRYKLASKRTLDYFPKKYLEYANNWLVVTDSSESRNDERHSSSCRMQLHNLTRVITSQKLSQRVAQML